MEKKILLPELPSIGEDIIVKPTKTERKQKYENKKANVNKSKKDIRERKPIKNDHKILKSAINGMVKDIILYNENLQLIYHMKNTKQNMMKKIMIYLLIR